MAVSISASTSSVVLLSPIMKQGVCVSVLYVNVDIKDILRKKSGPALFAKTKINH